jgi:hypothetical protein
MILNGRPAFRPDMMRVPALAKRSLIVVIAALATMAPRHARAVVAQDAAPANTLAAGVDAYVAKPRVLVMTDIANEPDDQMSMVRFLVYSNQFDIEGLVATTSTWMRNSVRPDMILSLIDAYERVQPNLLKHQPDFPAAATLRSMVAPGQSAYGMAAVGPDRMSAGAELIVRAADNGAAARGRHGARDPGGKRRWNAEPDVVPPHYSDHQAGALVPRGGGVPRVHLPDIHIED